MLRVRITVLSLLAVFSLLLNVLTLYLYIVNKRYVPSIILMIKVYNYIVTLSFSGNKLRTFQSPLNSNIDRENDKK